MTEQKEDLRIRKTKTAIRAAFESMILEMDYEKITIKELTERAMINRKTFYLHYQSLDELLLELQEEIADHFIREDVSYRSMEDIRRSIRSFFEYTCKTSALSERLLCSGSYSAVGDAINARIMKSRARTNSGAFSSDPLEDHLVFAFFGTTSIILYRQWVADGKKMPPEDLIRTASNLICSGLSAYVS